MKVGRNDPCPCGSGQKQKRCCLAREVEAHNAEAERRAREHRAREDARRKAAEAAMASTDPTTPAGPPTPRPRAGRAYSPGLLAVLGLLAAAGPMVDDPRPYPFPTGRKKR